MVGFCGSSGVILYPNSWPALAARALKFARSVPLRLGFHASRVPATAFVSVGLGGDYPWYAQSPLGLRSVAIRSPLRPA